MTEFSSPPASALQVGNSDIVRVSISPDADLQYLLAALEINPIEIKIVGLSMNDGRFSYVASYPRGVEVMAIKEADLHKHKVPDIGQEPYKRLLNDRDPGTGFHLRLVDISEEHLLSLKRYPLVLKLNQGNSFLVACPEQWKISKSEFAKTKFVQDPCSVPAVLDRMMTLLDEPVHREVKPLELYKRRLLLRKNFIAWYLSRPFTNEVTELLKGYAEEVDDELLAVELLLLDLKSMPDTFAELVMHKWSSALAELLPADTVSALKQKAIMEATRHFRASKMTTTPASAPIASLEVQPLTELLAGYSQHPGFAELVVDLCNPTDKMPIHNCGLCGAKAYYGKVKDDSPFYKVACSKCQNSLPANFHSQDVMKVIAAWNKRNPDGNAKDYLKTVFGGRFSNMQLDAVEAYANRVLPLADLIKVELADHHRVFKTPTTRELVRRNDILITQLGYLAVLTKQAIG